MSGSPARSAASWRAIHEACSWLATHTVRNQATVGGNITAAHFPSDLPPVLIALDSTLVVQGEDGRREFPVEDLYIRRSEVHRKGDLIVEVRIPAGASGRVSAFEKTGRARVDIAIVNCAVALALADGLVESARIALGGLAAGPVPAREAAKFLVGKEPGAGTFAEAGRLVASSVSPRSDHRASADYRRKMAGALTERALTRAALRENAK